MKCLCLFTWTSCLNSWIKFWLQIWKSVTVKLGKWNVCASCSVLLLWLPPIFFILSQSTKTCPKQMSRFSEREPCTIYIFMPYIRNTPAIHLYHPYTEPMAYNTNIPETTKQPSICLFPKNMCTGTSSIVTYTPMTELDYGTLLCVATNRIGRQRIPCAFHVIAAGIINYFCYLQLIIL